MRYTCFLTPAFPRKFPTRIFVIRDLTAFDSYLKSRVVLSRVESKSIRHITWIMGGARKWEDDRNN